MAACHGAATAPGCASTTLPCRDGRRRRLPSARRRPRPLRRRTASARPPRVPAASLMIASILRAGPLPARRDGGRGAGPDTARSRLLPPRVAAPCVGAGVEGDVSCGAGARGGSCWCAAWGAAGARRHSGGDLTAVPVRAPIAPPSPRRRSTPCSASRGRPPVAHGSWEQCPRPCGERRVPRDARGEEGRGAAETPSAAAHPPRLPPRPPPPRSRRPAP